MPPLDPNLHLLLLSTSTVFGSGYLDYAEAEIRDFFGRIRHLLFVPFALADHTSYAAKARERFAAMGIEITSLHEVRNPAREVDNAEGIFIGGGNTFRLLKSLYDTGALDAIRLRAQSGMPYMGASAGSNVACPTIRTTNDMPIAEPPSLNALNLFPWQINPHYVDADPGSKHMGETREERLIQYLEENHRPVIGLREGGIIRVENGRAVLKGTSGARIFRRGAPPEEVLPVRELDLRAV
jgi:dipeptidase E